MPREFKLPDLGEGVAEGEIVKWLVREGDPISEDQPMVEVMTDKATVQIPSPTSGKIGQIFAKEGQTVQVGTTLLTFAEDGRSVEKPPEPITPSSGPSQRAQIETQVTRPEASQVKPVVASPATRKLARELGVALEVVSGSGPGGRITDDDVRKAYAPASQTAQKLVEPKQPLAQHEIQKGPYAAQVASPDIQKSAIRSVREERQPLHGIRKVIAEKMSKSLRTAAHVTHVDEVDFSQLLVLKEKAKPIAEEKGAKLTLMPFIMKAVAVTLKEFPYFNASIDDEKQEVVLKYYYNIGFATDTKNGLIVPVVKDVDKKSVIEIAKELTDLSNKARDGKISLEEIHGGTFTVTNIGTLGGMISIPIINVPEVAILGVHKIQKKPVVREGQIVIRDVAFVSLSFDHRIVDGADAARFTTCLISMLENPGLIFLGSSDSSTVET